MAELSVVIPVYECAECLRALHERLGAALLPVTSDYELIFVDDRSTDDSWSVITELASIDPTVKGYRLSRNFRQHAAITAGVAQSTGDWVVVMDCDLEEPPEEIPRMLAKAREGFDVVFARRRSDHTSLLYRAARALWYRAFHLFTRTHVESDYGSLSVMSRKVADAYLQLRDRDREHILMLTWLGFSATTVAFERQPRFAGKSSYTLGTLVHLSFDRLFFQTTVLLRWIVYTGFALAVAGAGLALYFIVSRIVNFSYPGWTSLAVFTLTIGGFVIISTGVTGLYVGKVFDQVKERPLFVVDETTGEPGGAREEPGVRHRSGH